MNRREFSKTLALGFGAAAVAPAKSRNLKIGHTGITWRNNEIDTAIKDIASLGFYGFETFGNVIEDWEAKGGLGKVLDENNLPLISAYCSSNLTDPTKRKDEMDRMVAWGKLIKKYGGRVSVMGPNGVP